MVIYAQGSDGLEHRVPDRRVKLNVGGTRFETLASTLCKYPHSLLGKSKEHARTDITT